VLDGLTRPRVVGPSLLEKRKDVLRAFRRPHGEEVVMRIGESPAAPDRHETRVPHRRKDHALTLATAPLHGADSAAR
jgi:hypothetical protein